MLLCCHLRRTTWPLDKWWPAEKLIKVAAKLYGFHFYRVFFCSLVQQTLLRTWRKFDYQSCRKIMCYWQSVTTTIIAECAWLSPCQTKIDLTKQNWWLVSLISCVWLKKINDVKLCKYISRGLLLDNVTANRRFESIDCALIKPWIQYTAKIKGSNININKSKSLLRSFQYLIFEMYENTWMYAINTTANRVLFSR